MRYWFFMQEIPDGIVALIESDAKELLWAENPELRADELGTAKRTRRFMNDACYLPYKEGGGNITRLRLNNWQSC